MISLGSAVDFLEGYDADRWGSEYAERPISWVRVIFAFFPAALYWILNVRKTVDDMQGWFYVNMLFVYGATYLAAFSSTLAARFALYPLPFVALGLVYVTAVEDVRERNLIRALVLVLFSLFMYVEISGTENLRNFQWLFERQ